MNHAPAPEPFSGPVTVFHERPLPERATPAGYAALIHRYGLAVPLPRTLSATGAHHRTVERDGWRITTPRHAPSPDLEGHLTFALKYEGTRSRRPQPPLSRRGTGGDCRSCSRQRTGTYARRIWFLYEWLTGTRLDLPDLTMGSYVPVVDPEQQYAVEGVFPRATACATTCPARRNSARWSSARARWRNSARWTSCGARKPLSMKCRAICCRVPQPFYC